MAQLLGIAVRKQSKAPMLTLRSAAVTRNCGVANDLRGKPGNRQVTVIAEPCWAEACTELDTDLNWLTRRANLLVSDIRFGREHIGKILHIGAAQLLITRETDPCIRMEQAHRGLLAALTPQWRGGVCCKVLVEGNITIGDTVRIEDDHR